MSGHETFCAAPLSPPCSLFASANGLSVVCAAAAPCHGGLGGGVGRDRGWLWLPPTADLLVLLSQSQALLSRGCVLAPSLVGEGCAAGWKAADAEFQCAL